MIKILLSKIIVLSTIFILMLGSSVTKAGCYRFEIRNDTMNEVKVYWLSSQKDWQENYTHLGGRQTYTNTYTCPKATKSLVFLINEKKLTYTITKQDLANGYMTITQLTPMLSLLINVSSKALPYMSYLFPQFQISLLR